MGSGSAFYTFISQQARGRTYYVMYYAWLLIQFAVSILLVAVLMPQSMLDRVWLGHSRQLILLALIAAFMQQQVWTTVTQIGESSRQTVKVQLLGLSIIGTHSVVILFLYFGQLLSVATVLSAIIFEYIVATVVSTRLLTNSAWHQSTVPEERAANVLGEYWRYCRPLFLVAIASFVYELTDRWMLQKYGGATQQGFYQISAQLATICLLATTSILNIFWKEISEANSRQDKARVAYLYNKVNRGLIMLAALISCFMVPWAEQIVVLLLGTAYQESWPIFAVMLIYPIHQSMGQVNGTMFLACSHTKMYTVITIIGQVISIPVTYLLLASSDDIFIPGLGLGALGLALKMVGMNILLVNVQAWLIAHLNGWRYEWKYQLIGISAALSLAYFIKQLICFAIPTATLATEHASFILAILLSGLVYLAGMSALLWHYPTIAGLEKPELRAFIEKYNPLQSRPAEKN